MVTGPTQTEPDRTATSDRLRRIGEQLEAEDHLLDALEVLRAADRTHPDPALEEHLVRLANRAFSELDRSPGHTEWPPPLPDPFPDVDGIPEVGPEDLSTELIGGAILHHGALIVRGLTGASWNSRLREDIDRAIAGHDVAAARTLDPTKNQSLGTEHPVTTPWYVTFQPAEDYAAPRVGERAWVRDSGSVWTLDSPRTMADLLELFEVTGLGVAIAGYFGERPALSLDKWTLRRAEPGSNPADWHQDGAFLGANTRTINVWHTLTRCGADADAVGIEIVPRRLHDIVETGTEGATFDWSVGPGVVERLTIDQPTVCPLFEAGDAALFDERNLHRTAAREGLKEPRYAIESWFFAPSSYPENRIPVVF